MAFDLQSIWTGAGLAAAAVVIGLIFGFVQSAVPIIPSSGTLRDWVLIVICAGLVALAAVTSGAKPDPSNVFAAILVFIGLYNASKNAHGAGEATAEKTVGVPPAKPIDDSGLAGG
jgi:hypothetical protein